MKNWDRQKLYLGWVCLLLLLLPVVGSAALAPATTYPGTLRIVGPLQLELKVTPPIGTPGDTLVLELSLVNLDQVTYQPEVSLQLPLGLRLNVANLPPGATVNLQANRLTWVPIVSANGGTQQFALPLRVETADILHPEQTITAVLKFNNQEQEAATTLWIGIPPHVSRVILPGQVSVGLPIQLRADLNGPGPISQSWQLGDGRRVDVSDPVVVYPAAGMYDVTLTASNAIGAATAVRRITIVPHPTAQFKVEDDTPGVGQPVRFVNESGGQTPITYRWDFGDGATSADAQPAHVYTSPGVYQVRLSIENAFGRSEALWPLTVGLPPAADMALDEFASSGQPVRALGLGDDTVTAFRWDMGDGRTHEGAQISHIYALPGNYYITMAAANQFGEAQVSRWLAVQPGIMAVYLPAIMALDSEAIVPGASLDPLGIVLEPVDLETPFVMAPLDLPTSTSPAEQLFVYINEARRQFDLPPLQYVYELTVAAQQHTEDMVAYRYTGHTGSDGSTPAERLLWHGYSRAYAGEATAWGFEQAYQAVEFWVNSPGHRAIILNKYATEVGVAFTANFSAPNVWYWTAEFGAYGAPEAPTLRVRGPLSGASALNSEVVDFAWNWPLPLAEGQQFTLYLLGASQSIPMGSVAQPAAGTLYRLRTAVMDVTPAVGSFEWQVRLEDGRQNTLLWSEPRSLEIVADPDLPTPTPVVTPTLAATATPTPTPTPTSTPTPNYPMPTPRPTDVVPPIIVTAPSP